MEIFDVVDQYGQPTAETIERAAAHQQGIRHRTAHVWVIRQKEGQWEVLLQKRAADKDSFPGCYDTSSAGHIHAGDEPKDSALRELSEELGIHASAEDLRWIRCFDIAYEKTFHGYLFRDNEISFVYAYAEPIDETSLCLQKEEVESVQWFSLAELERALNPRDPRFCVPNGGFTLIKQWCETQNE